MAQWESGRSDIANLLRAVRMAVEIKEQAQEAGIPTVPYVHK